MARNGAFVKGDPRINRNGRPKSFDELRALAREIANEIVKNEDGSPLIIEGKPVSRIELILRQWATSEFQASQNKFAEIAYGKVPDKVEVTGEDGAPWVVTVKQFTPKPDENTET